MKVEKELVPHFDEKTVEKEGGRFTLYRGEGTAEEVQAAATKIENEGRKSDKVVIGDFQLSRVDTKGNQDTIDQIFVRSKDMIITVKADSSGVVRGENANYYALYVGKEIMDVNVLSPDRQLVRQITTDLIKKIKELGDDQLAMRWLENDSPYASMKNPYDGSDLLAPGMPDEEMFKKKE